MYHERRPHANCRETPKGAVVAVPLNLTFHESQYPQHLAALCRRAMRARRLPGRLLYDYARAGAALAGVPPGVLPVAHRAGAADALRTRLRRRRAVGRAAPAPALRQPRVRRGQQRRAVRAQRPRPGRFPAHQPHGHQSGPGPGDPVAPGAGLPQPGRVSDGRRPGGGTRYRRLAGAAGRPRRQPHIRLLRHHPQFRSRRPVVLPAAPAA